MRRAALLLAFVIIPCLAACGQRTAAPYAVDAAMQHHEATQNHSTSDEVRISSDYQPLADAEPTGLHDALPEPSAEDEIQALLGALDPSGGRIIDQSLSPQSMQAELLAPLDQDPAQWSPELWDQYQALGALMAEHPGLQAKVTAFDDADLGHAQLRAEALQRDMIQRFDLPPGRILAMGLSREYPGPDGQDMSDGLRIEMSGLLRPQGDLAQGVAPQERAARSAVLRFEEGETGLNSAMDGRLQALALVLRDNPGAALRVEGHTDSVGSRQSNRLLSRERALAVKSLLVNTYGVSPERIFAIGYGEERPVADNDTEQGRGLNRRVEVTLAPDAMVLPQVATTQEFEIEVSISSCRLWLYAHNAGGARSLVRTYEVATAGEGIEVPYGQGFITGIDLDPWWYPTASMIRRAESQGRTLEPTPPGSAANPMGAFKIHLSHGGPDGAFRIHGTNRPAQIGRRVSLGCIRMHNDEGLQLARLVRVGTPVSIVP